jgi:hypothetical protein
MLASDKLLGVRAKIERANEHILNLHSALAAFRDSRPYKILTKHDENTRELIYYVASLNPTPARVLFVTGDAIQNLRSALDYLVCRLVEANRGTVTSDTSYPVFKDATVYHAQRLRKVQGMRQDAINFIDATKPYKGGTDDLWRLHKLNNIDKHRLLLTIGAEFQSINLGAHAMGLLQQSLKSLPDGHPLRGAILPAIPAYFRTDTLRPLKVGDELFRDAPDAKVNEKMDFRFEVAFNEPGIAEGDSLTVTLQRFADLVGGIVDGAATTLF